MPPDKEGKTPLMYTLSQVPYRDCEIPHRKGRRHTALADNNGHRPLDMPAHGLRDAVIACPAGGADTDTSAGNTPLHQAVYNGQSEE